MTSETRWASRLAGRAAVVLVAALLGLALFLLACAYIGSEGPFDSDNLYPSDLCADLRLGRPLTGWHLPGAPYLFPDVLWLLPCQLLPRGVAGEFLGYCFAQWLCFVAAITWLGREVGLRWRPALLAALAGTLLLSAAHLDEAYRVRAAILVCPGSHVGIIPVGLVMLALAVRMLRRGFGIAPVTAFLVMGGLGGFSDKLLLVQFLAPLAGALILLTCGRIVSIRAAAGLLGLMSVVGLLCGGLRFLFTHLGFQLLQIENNFTGVHGADLRVLLRQVYDTIEGQYLIALAMAVYVAASALVVAAWIRRRSGGTDVPAADPARREVLVAALALALVPWCNLGALFFTGLSGNSAVYRYTLPLYLLPPLLAGWLLSLLPGRAAGWGRLVLPLLIVVFASWRMAQHGPQLAAVPLQPPYPPLAQALDQLVRQHGPMHGLAEFWTARRMRFLTHEHVALCPLDRYGMPFVHASNPGRWLADDPHDMSLPRYGFVVVQPGCNSRDPGPELTALLYGLPCERIAAGTHEIWLYDHLHSTQLDRFLHSRVAERLRTIDPGIGPDTPACLAQPKANLTPLAASGNVHLAPGQSVELHFSAPVRGQTLDIGAGHDDWLEVDLFAGSQRLSRLQVPQVPLDDHLYGFPGLQSRLLPLCGQAFDRAVVRSRPGMAGATLGHFLVHRSKTPDTGVGPSQRIPGARLEAEWLPTFVNGLNGCLDLMASSTPDPQASNGRVRQAASNFEGIVTFTTPLSLPAGRYRLDFGLRVADNTARGELASIDVLSFAPPALLTRRSLCGADFPHAGRFTPQSLPLNLEQEAHFLVLRVLSQGKTALAVDYIDIIALPQPTSSAATAASGGIAQPGLISP